MNTVTDFLASFALSPVLFVLLVATVVAAANWIVTLAMRAARATTMASVPVAKPIRSMRSTRALAVTV